MILRWTKPAVDDLTRICDFTEERFGASQARRAALAIYDSVESLRPYPLSNAAQHSGAEHVRVRLVREGDRVELTVGDDGSGFTFDQAARGLGIAGMRERALLVGGGVEVESRPDVGTRVSLTVPLDLADTGVAWWKHNGRTGSRR